MKVFLKLKKARPGGNWTSRLPSHNKYHGEQVQSLWSQQGIIMIHTVYAEPYKLLKIYLQELRIKCFIICNQPNIQSLMKLQRIFFLSVGFKSGLLHLVFKSKSRKVVD